MASVSYILSYIQSAKRRFGDFAKISYRLSGISADGINRTDCFLWEIETMKRVDGIYIRVCVPHSIRIFDITSQVVTIQRALRKHRRK